MALIFCDGFDHYGTEDILKKWTSYSVGNLTIDNNLKRTGNSSLRMKPDVYEKYCNKSLVSSYQTLVVGCACRFFITRNYIGFKFSDNITNHVAVRIDANFKINIYRNTTLLGVSENAICLQDEWVYLEIKVYIHDSEGYVTIKKNGDVFYNLTGIDTRNNANASINYFSIVALGVTSMYGYFDDLYIDDSDFLGDIKVETIYPSGAGTTTQWDALSGANYENVDEASQDDDTSYISTATANEIDTYTFGNLATTSGTVYGVQVNMMARKDDAGSRTIAPVVRPSNIDRIGNSVSVSDSYVNHIQMYNTNPDDSEAWTIADVNDAEFGVKLIE